MFRFRKIELDDAEMLYKWRSSERVNACMCTDMTATFEEHCNWILEKQADPTYRFWIVEFKDKPIGLVDLEDIDFENKSCEWGYYIGEETALGIGGLIPPLVYNYVFFELGLERIFTEVLDSNQRILKLHKLHGFAYLRCNQNAIFKGGTPQDTHSLELTRAKWESLYKKLTPRLEKKALF